MISFKLSDIRRRMKEFKRDPVSLILFSVVVLAAVITVTDLIFLLRVYRI